MTRLDWASAPRRYESGVDHGVLYPSEGPGVPWNGLVTVDESHTGGDMASYYFDGIKYLEKQNPKNFQATITAFSAPKEFSQCIGELPVIPGFILTRQPRKQFGFSYRTLIEDGDEYKIHVVYNATASPESRGYSTIDGSAFATSFSWKIDAVPPKVSGFRPSAHFVLDSTKTDLFTLRAIEDILYGTETSDPRLPLVEELVDIVGLWEPKLIVPSAEPPEALTNHITNPEMERETDSVNTPGIPDTYSRSGTAEYAIISSPWGSGKAWQMTITTTGTDGRMNNSVLIPVVPGDIVTWLFRHSGPKTRAKAGIEYFASDGSYAGGSYQQIPAADGDGWSKRVWVIPSTGTYENKVPAGIRTMFYTGADGISGDAHVVDRWFVFAGKTSYDGSYFDGDTPDDLEFTYEWTGTPHASTSIRKTRPIAYLTPGLGDLTPSKVPGIYRDLPTTRLAETAVGGLYRLE